MYFIMACPKAFVRKYLNDKKTWFDWQLQKSSHL